MGIEEITTAEETQGDAEPAAKGRAGDLLHDIVNLYVRPSALFDRLPWQNRAAAALVILMLLQVLYAAAVVSTGIHDYEIDYATELQISRLRHQQQGDQNSDKKMTADLDLLEKGAVFNKTLARLALLVGGPVRLLIAVCVTAGVLFMSVALRGGKPNFALLFGVVVFASWVEVPQLATRLVSMVQGGNSRVETSAAAFFSDPSVGLPAYLLLRRLDPFDFWFYSLVGFGVCRTGQLGRRAAFVTVCLLALLGAVWHLTGDLAELANIQVSMGNGEAN